MAHNDTQNLGSREKILDKETTRITTTSNTSSRYPAGQQPRSKRQRVCGICKKFWWLFLGVLIIGVLAVTLPLVFVGFPKIIQDKLNGATVTLDGLRITQPTPDTVFMEMNSTLHSSGGISAVIDSFNASLYLEDKPGHIPFAYMTMPQTSAAKTVLVNVSQHLQLWNVDEYTTFNTWFLLNETFRLTLDGETLVHVGGLKPVKANFHKTVTVNGLNGFKGLDVTSFDISLTPDKKGDNVHGFISIPNPSVLTVEIGNATFNNNLNGTFVGQLFADDLTLYPGNNNVSIRANISQAPILTAVTTQPNCKTGIVNLDVSGESVVFNGQHIPYYETGFKENHNSVALNVGQALAKVLGKAPSCPS